MTLKAKILIPAVILVFGFAIMYLFLNMRGESSRRKPQQQTKIVETEIVKLNDIPTTIIGYGRVASAQPIQLYSEVSGIIQNGEIPFKPAQSFSKGDLILKIDDRQAILSLNSAKSDLLNALANFLPEIKAEFPNEYNIWQDYFNECKFESKLQELPEIDNQKIKLYLSRYNVYKLYFAIRDLEIKLEKHYFYAPFSGSITSTNQRVGSITRNGSLLGEIINLAELEVEVPISAQDIQWIKKEIPVALSSSEVDGEWTGKINRIGNAIDDRTQTVQVFVKINNNHKYSIFEGMFFEVHISGLIINNSISIPRKALYSDQFVYLIDNGKLKYQKIEIARMETSSVIVNGGLADGDTLVTEAVQGVFAGMSAKPKMTSVKAEVGNE